MYSYVKRILDIVLSFSILLIILPLLLFLMILIRIETTGSPLFLQKRIGRYGKQFTLVKLRSMVNNAAQLGSFQTAANDFRITSMGRFLRMTSLDELPQLWNVLAGNMSLIGPRPETPAQEALYSPRDWLLRHQVKPGITGLAQVSGRSILSPEDRLKFDLEYAANPSFHMDAQIALKTLQAVFTGRGAN
jgi:lipopolysaccharide/colanic/teichoic acid biosynthesis glycosyltransferase